MDKINNIHKALERAKNLGCVKYKCYLVNGDEGDILHVYFFDENNRERCYFSPPFSSYNEHKVPREWDEVFLYAKNITEFYEIEEGYPFGNGKNHPSLRKAGY